MKKYLILAVLLCSASIVFSQTELSAFSFTGAGYSTSSVTDYQCLGINPANLGWSRNDHTMNLGFTEFGFTIYSEQLTRKQVVNDLFDSNIKLDLDEKDAAAGEFTDTRLIGIGSFMGVGFSYQDEEIGGFAFNVRERLVWHSFLNDKAADFLFKGWHDPYFDSLAVAGEDTTGYSTNALYASEIYEGTEQNFLYFREFNFGYGRKVLKTDDINWYAGVGLKYLVGYGMLQYHQSDDGTLVGYSSLSPIFEVEYDDPTPSQVEGSGYKKVGSGFGFDIGTTVEYKEKLRISLALNDIGSIKWDGNVYQGNDVRVVEMDTDGMDNYNVFSEGQLINADDLDDETSLWEGIESQTLNLPMNFRGGASYKILDVLEAGADFYLPLGDKVPGMYEKPIFCFGGKFDAAEWVQFSAGVVSGGKFGTNAQLGILFYPIKTENTTWEIGIANRNILSIFKQENPTVSLAFGFLRFSFGAKEASTRYIEEEE